MDYEEISVLWRDGERRLASADPSERAALERVRDAIVAELRRRLGGPFSTRELVALYERDGTDWCLAVAVRAAPADPAAWDMTTGAGAAFARYAPRGQRLPHRAAGRTSPGMEPE